MGGAFNDMSLIREEEIDFKSYLQIKGIKLVESFNNDLNKKSIREDHILEQLYNITLFHKKTLGYKNYFKNEVNNRTGKNVEKNKVALKKVKKFLYGLQHKTDINEFENILLEELPKYIKRGEKSINFVYEDSYLDLILRSMKRREICLSKVYFDNLRKTNDLEIIEFNNCCYDMVEIDAIDFLYKIKKKNLKVDKCKLIKEFCSMENLQDSSYNFILGMISYPYYIIRCCTRYMYKKKNWNEKQYINSFNKAKKMDGDSLI